jgi:hypothetical protein
MNWWYCCGNCAKSKNFILKLSEIEEVGLTHLRAEREVHCECGWTATIEITIRLEFRRTKFRPAAQTTKEYSNNGV